MSNELRNAPLGERVALVRLVADLRGGKDAERYMEALGLNISTATAEVEEPAYDMEGMECLRALLDASFNEGRTIRQEIEIALQANPASDARNYPRTFGLVVDPAGHTGIFVAERAGIPDFYKNTRWSDGRHVAGLLRIKGAKRKRSVKFCGGYITCDAVAIPMWAVLAV